MVQTWSREVRPAQRGKHGSSHKEDSSDLYTHLRRVSPNIIVNLIGSTSRSEQKLMQSNIVATTAYLSAIRRYLTEENCPVQFIHISSYAVNLPYSSSGNMHKISCYQASKAISENKSVEFIGAIRKASLHIFRPATILTSGSFFTQRLRLILLLLPFKTPSNKLGIPYTTPKHIAKEIKRVICHTDSCTTGRIETTNISSYLPLSRVYGILARDTLSRAIIRIKPSIPARVLQLPFIRDIVFYLPCKPFSCIEHDWLTCQNMQSRGVD